MNKCYSFRARLPLGVTGTTHVSQLQKKVDWLTLGVVVLSSLVVLQFVRNTTLFTPPQPAQ